MHEFVISRKDSWLRQRAAECFLVLALAPAFAWMSPFHTNHQSFLTRFGYWGGMFACWFVTMAIVGQVFQMAGLLRRVTPLVRGVAMVGVAALPMILIVSPATQALKGWEPSVPQVLELYFQIALIGSSVSLVAWAMFVSPLALDVAASASIQAPVSHRAIDAPLPADAPAAELAAASHDEQTGTSALLARLPLKVRGAIIALEMEDHYVRVHTEHGSALVLLRLSDAIKETVPTEGRQVHRSWWVADDAIEDFARVGRTGQVRLSNGLTAPVSQRYLRDLDQLPLRPTSATPSADQR